ncbi:hypothetical protein WJ438_01755 [Streptomyces sp. GD-15H]|uniref:hypothetical protein n=1 Tax=Streptomyces sp. GD-15H TaxID=3129112 RepID=UPI00324B95C0
MNADPKHHVHAARAISADALAHETRRFLHRRRRQPHVVCGYFAARHVRYTIQWETRQFRLNITGPSMQWLAGWPRQFIIAWPIAFAVTMVAWPTSMALSSAILKSRKGRPAADEA